MNILIDRLAHTFTLVLLAMSFAAMLFMWFQFLPLEEGMSDRGGYAIVEYELAFTASKVSDIDSTWGQEARAAALQSL